MKKLLRRIFSKKTFKKKVILTVVTSDYFYQTIPLGNSIQRFEKETDFIVFVIGYNSTDPDYHKYNFQVLDAKLLLPEEWKRFVFQYNTLALCCALKPLALKYGLRFYKKALYLDADIKLFHSLRETWDALNTAEISLTPHKNRAPEITIPLINAGMQRRAGIFNAGYMGVSRRGEYFLNWWWKHVHYNCIDGYAIGIHFDQLYLNQSIGLVDHLHIMKNCGYNVGWWNIDQKKIKKENESYLVNKVPLIFFHFSMGTFVLHEYHSNAFIKGQIGELYFQIYTKYFQELSLLQKSMTPKPYPYHHFQDGEIISDAWREWMRRDIPELRAITNPFSLLKAEREKIETIMQSRPPYFHPNKSREIKD